MVEVHCEADIQATSETIFAAIVDLRGYDRWLTPSKAYAGTTEISTDPIAAGTTYVEDGPTGVRNGTITEFQPATRVRFEQRMTMKPRLLGVIGIDVTYTLTPDGASVHVDRVVRLSLPVQLQLARPIVVRQIRAESTRTMAALKSFAETPA
jgi:uncharacterized protein YndB with AHSA1/START domain